MDSSIVTKIGVQDGISIQLFRAGKLVEHKVVSDKVEIDKIRKEVKLKEVKHV